MRNPLPATSAEEKGEVRRRVFCERYGECLDKAVIADVGDFSCDGCHDYAPLELSPEEWLMDALGCARLIGVVYGLRIMSCDYGL